MKIGDTNRILPIPSSKFEPFPMSYFKVYFKNTYHVLCQIIGIDVEDNMLVQLMRMAMIIQHPESMLSFILHLWLKRKFMRVCCKLRRLRLSCL